ncbi:MAG: hypothetical protein AAB797_02065 [Patescibacteria group bacterium]
MSKNKEKSNIQKIGQRTLHSELEKWQFVAQGEASSDEQAVVSDEKKEDIKELEIQAASEDIEFKKWEEKFVDAKYNMEEFIGYIKSHNLKRGKEESIKNLRTRLEEMWNLLKKKNYEQFKNKFDEFNDILENLYPSIGQEPVKTEPYKKDEGVEKLVAAMGLREEEPTEEKKPEEAPPSIKLFVESRPIALEVVKPVGVEPAATESATPSSQTEPKKNLWGKFKERGKKISDAIFNRETGKMAGKMSYDTITSGLGIKLVTDIMQGWTGKGDLAEWWKGRKESESSKKAIAEAYQNLMQSVKKADRKEILAESEKIETRLVEFKTQVESARISPEAKKELLDRLITIAEKHQRDIEMAVKERDAEVRRVLDAYVQAKISGIKIAKDAMNFALTAAGFTLLRGVAYAGASIAERVGKAKKEYVKRDLKNNSRKTELVFVAKDVLVNSTIETVRALTGQGEKKGASGKARAFDFIKALGTVARGFGIYGVAVSGAELPSQSIDKLINAIKEQGVASTVSDNFIQNVKHVIENAERAGHFITHPTEIFTDHKVSTAPKLEEHHEISAASEHPAIAEPAHEVPVATPERMDHTIAVEVLNNKEGILHGVNKIIHSHQDVFTHADSKPWTANEIHLWKVRELKDMGFKFEGGKWGYPVTVHAGAQVEVYTDAQGQPHFKLASEENVTFNKNYKWVETKSAESAPVEEPVSEGKETFKIVDTGAVSGQKGDYLINPFPDDAGVSHTPNSNANVLAESATSHAPVKVDANIKEVAVVHHAPKESAVGGAKVSEEKVSAAPEVVAGEKTVDQFLKEHNSNPKEFVRVYDKMVDSAIERLQNSLILRGGADKFLQSRINALYQIGLTQESISSADSRSLAMMEKILDAEDKFKLNQPDWLKTFRQTVFDKSDKDIQLALLPDRDVLLEPVKTNGGHAARIWDEIERKDVFIYDKDRIFNTNEDGRLIVEDENGQKTVLTQKEALRIVETDYL